MSSIFSNPNNHVPEVTPDDGWEDDGNDSKVAMLPPRRVIEEVDLIVPHEQGILIDVKTYSSERRDFEGAAGFAVREIGGVPILLEESLPRAKRVVAVKSSTTATLPAYQPRHPRGEGREWGVSSKKGMLWLLLAGVGVVCVVITAMALWPRMQKKQDAGEKSVYSSASVEEEAPLDGLEKIEELSIAEGRAREIFKRYANAKEIDEFIPLVRNGAELRERIGRYWRPLGMKGAWEPARDAVWSVVSAGGIQTGVLTGLYPDFTKYSAIFIMENARPYLDWEATFAYSSATFAELDAGIGDPSVIRGYLASGEFYTADFPEYANRSMSLTSPDGQHTIWIYIKRGSMADGVLAELFDVGDILEKSTNQLHLVTVSLRRPNGITRPNQWLVGEMLHIGWLVP